MATTIRTKRTVDAGKAPAAGSLALGELAVNVTDKKLWVGDASGDPQELVGGTGGGGGGLHNDLDGRTVALCHPLASIYDPADGDKNLADILNGKISEPPSTPINTYYARGFDNQWHAIDLSVPAAEWGSITGNISAQSDLFSTFPAKASANTITGQWTFGGTLKGAYFGAYAQVVEGTSYGMNVIGLRGYFASSSGQVGIWVGSFPSGNWGLVARDSQGQDGAKFITSAGERTIYHSGNYPAVLREFADALPAAVMSRASSGDLAGALSEAFKAFADKLEAHGAAVEADAIARGLNNIDATPAMTARSTENP